MKDFNIKKLYYSISEVSKITEVEQYVLRYWETEFDQLKPQKNRAGNRAYTNKDIQIILLIKSLLRDKKYTIEGAKAVITDYGKNDTFDFSSDDKNGFIASHKDVNSSIQNKQEDKSLDVKKDLLEIKSFLEILLTKL